MTTEPRPLLRDDELSTATVWPTSAVVAPGGDIAVARRAPTRCRWRPATT